MQTMTPDYATYLQFVRGFQLHMFKGEYCIDNGLRLGWLTPYYAQKLRDEFFSDKNKVVIPADPQDIQVQPGVDEATITAD